MSHIDTTQAANALKRVYGNRLQELFARHTVTINEFRKSNRKATPRVGGSAYYFGVRRNDIEGVGARSEGQYLPEPLEYSPLQGYITPKLLYAVIRLSGLVIEAGKSNIEAFVNILSDATQNAFKSLVVDMNRQCWGDGFGKLGTVTTKGTPATGSTWTVTFNDDMGTRYMRKGMICDFYASGGAIDQSASAVRIDSINPATNVVTFEAVGTDGKNYRSYHPITAAQSYTKAASSIPVSSQLVRYGARDVAYATSDTPVEMVGLLGQYDDGTLLDTFEGINADTYAEWRANIMGNSDVNRNLSIDLMLAAMDMTLARSGKQPDIIRMGLGQRRKYFGLLEGDIRFAPQQIKGGYENLSFSQNGAVRMVVDPYAQPNKMFFEVDGAIKRYELTPIGWGGFDPNKMHWRENYDQTTMFLRTYVNLGTENRRDLTLLDDLTEPSSLPW